MFDVGASELVMIVVVAVVVIGPKDLPLALRTAGRWIGKMRRMSAHFRSGIDAMVREAELEEMEKKWREQNEAIMRAHPQTAALPTAESMVPPETVPPAPLSAAPAEADGAAVEPAPATTDRAGPPPPP